MTEDTKKLLIFDFDGVIAESTVDRKTVLKDAGFFTVIGGYFGIKKFKDKVDSAVYTLVDKDYNNIKPARNLINMIKKSNLKKAICSLNSHKIITRFLTENDIENEFEIIVGIEDMKYPKPLPNGINMILKAVGVSKKETIFIGDSWTDSLSGKLAGTETCNITKFLQK